MTQEEILEYNKRCAELLELPLVTTLSKEPLYVYKGSQYYLHKLKFHSDWNLIMEVIEAIERAGFATQISHRYCCSNYGNDSCSIDTEENAFYDEEEPIIFKLTTSKKEAVVEAINQFLIWYNNEQRT